MAESREACRKSRQLLLRHQQRAARVYTLFLAERYDPKGKFAIDPSFAAPVETLNWGTIKGIYR
jgi:hypothetical protein